jgi:rSAM/selenodomain-associated transferase 2
MRAPITVIIPTLNAGATLVPCLGSLGPALMEGLIAEVIISDGGSSDCTVEIAQEAGARVITGPKGRGGQLRRGAQTAVGEWLLFLHADTVLSADWAHHAQAHIQSGAGAAPFRLAFDARGVWPWAVAGWANLRSRVFQLPYGDQGLLVARDLYAQIGGYPDIPLMEDVAIARALRGRITLLPAIATTSAARYQAEGWARRGVRNMWFLTRYFCGADPARLARRYNNPSP